MSNWFRQTKAKISAFLSGNVGRYEIFSKQKCFTTKGLVRKKCNQKSYYQKICIFIFKQRIKNTNWHCKKTKYQGFDKIYEFDKKQ